MSVEHIFIMFLKYVWLKSSLIVNSLVYKEDYDQQINVDC